MARIMFARDSDTGWLVSRVDSDFAWPIMAYGEIGADGDYTKPINYKLEKVSIFDVTRRVHDGLVAIGPGKLTAAEKNPHRKFWGMKPVKEKP